MIHAPKESKSKDSAPWQPEAGSVLSTRKSEYDFAVPPLVMGGPGEEEKQDTPPRNQSYYETAPRKSKKNKYTRAIRVPNGNPTYRQFTTLGIPCTDASWERQDQIDQGKLHTINNIHFLRELPEEIRENVDIQKFTPLLDLEHQLPVEEREKLLKELNALVRKFDDPDKGKNMTTFGNMSKRDFTKYQESILDDYIDIAATQGKNASFMLDVLPTETAKFDPLDFISPKKFLGSEHVMDTRQPSVDLAQEEQREGKQTFGLVVPYSNTVENILARGADPRDGVRNLRSYIQQIEERNPDIATHASGYSQGGTVVLNYAKEYGKQDGLDSALALAPMGGIDGHGGTGVGSGELGANADHAGVPTLAVSHPQDPAHGVYPGMVLPGAIAFAAAKQSTTDIHVGVNEVDGQPKPQMGTKGYPLSELNPLIRALVNPGEHGSTEYGHIGVGPYGRRGDWDKEIPNFKKAQPTKPSAPTLSPSPQPHLRGQSPSSPFEHYSD